MSEIKFCVETCSETGGFVARWDDSQGGGITTQGDTLAELHAMIADAVKGYFEPGTLKGILEQAGITIENFQAHL